MTDRSRRRFLKSAAVGGALTGGAVLLPSGLARAAAASAEAATDSAIPTSAGTVADVRQDRAAPQFQLTVVNNSANVQDFCVYQAPVDLGVADALSLAWITAPAYPHSTVTFIWTQSYNFVWSDTASLAPGIVFKASQVLPADPNTPAQQEIQFSYQQGAYTFLPGQPVAQPQAGNLYIQQSSTVPVNEASVGIGMSGAATLVLPAQPNTTLIFAPHPEYWITAGVFETGQALSVEQITNSARVAFPAGIFAMTAVLNPDNTWTLAPTGS